MYNYKLTGNDVMSYQTNVLKAKYKKILLCSITIVNLAILL